MNRFHFKVAATLSFLLLASGLSAQQAAPAKNLIKAALAVRGGTSYETAVPMEFNRDYKLDHHQKTGEFDYFYIPVEPDTVVTLEARTFDKGVSWNKNRRAVTTEPFAGLRLEDDKKASVASADINATPNMVQKASFRNRKTTGGRYYVLVGSPLGGMNKDGVIFKATVAPFIHGDLGVAQDAGSNSSAALPVAAGKYYPVNSIGGDDLKDAYSFSASKKEWYAVAVRAVDPIPTAFTVTIEALSEKGRRTDKKVLASYTSGGAEQVITKSFEIPKDGLYVIEIGLMNPVKEKSLYSLELSKAAE